MGILDSLKGGLSDGGAVVSHIAKNSIFRSALGVALVGSLLSPLFFPFVPLLFYSAAALAVGTAALSLGARFTGSSVKWLGKHTRLTGSLSDDGLSSQALKDVKDGKKTGKTVVDGLVSLLRGNGLKVTTDWEEAKKVLAGLPEKYDYLKGNEKSLRGFVYQGIIFLNPKNADDSVPIHEYTHLWAEALRQKDADRWNSIVELVKKEAVLWVSIKKNYPHLESDDEIADEVLATYSGQRGMQRLAEFTKEGESPKDIFSHLLKALEEFWKEVSQFFGYDYKTIDEVADRALYDMLNGMDPNKHIDHNKITLSDRTPLADRGVRVSGKELKTTSNTNNMSYYKKSYQKKASSDEHRPIKDVAVEKFSELIITRMEQIASGEWKQGWFTSGSVGLPENIESGVLNGTNMLTLLFDTMAHDYSMPVYMTFKQAGNLGVRINDGAEAIPVVYYNLSYKDQQGNPVSKEDYMAMSEAERQMIDVKPFLKGYYEFNIDQTNFKEVAPEKYEELRLRFRGPDILDEEGMYSNAALDRMIERQEWLCPINFDKTKSCPSYSPSRDIITSPFKAQFKISNTPEEIYKDGMEYYASIIHECEHSTGTEKRLNRSFEGRFGDKDYGYEECIAELSTAVVGKTLGFEKRILKNNENYVRGWIEKIKEKPSIIINMVGDIGKAANMFLEKVNEQKIALGEKPILGKDSLLDEEEVKEVQQRSAVKRIIGFIVERSADPSPYARFSSRQAYIIQKYLSDFTDKPERDKEVNRIWGLAEKTPEMRKTDKDWKEEARKEFDDIANGIVREERGRGIGM